jgi:hypothetical protein
MADEATLDILLKIRSDLAGLTEAQNKVTSFGQAIKTGFGIETVRRGIDFLTSSVGELARGALTMAKGIKEGSDAVGVSTDHYQVMQIELMKAGVDMSRFTMAVQAQTVSMAAARDVTSSAADNYRALSLTVAELEKMTPEERVVAVARAAINATDKTRAFQAAGEILGQRGLQPLLNGLKTLAADGFDKVTASAKASGEVMSKDLVEKVNQAQENFEAARRRLVVGAVSTAQSVMSYFGGAAGRTVNAWQGLARVSEGEVIGGPPKPAAATAPAAPSLARGDQQLLVQLEGLKQKTDAYNSSLFTESEKRSLLLPILSKQIDLYQKLGETYFGKDWETQRTALLRKLDSGSITEPELKNLQTMNDLEEKLRTARRERMETVDTPLAKMARELNDTTSFTQQTLAGGLSTGITGLTNDIIAASRGTQSWGSAFRNLATTAADVLQQIITRMLVIEMINSALGIFGYSLGGAGGIVSVGATKVVGIAGGGGGGEGVMGAGGGNFLTHGPTKFTVGDNPGGVELVSVLPLSGVGRSTINGQAIHMGGGGSALVGGALRSGDTFNFNYEFNGGVSRQEVLGMIPQIVQASKGAVLDAQRRRLDGFGR